MNVQIFFLPKYFQISLSLARGIVLEFLFIRCSPWWMIWGFSDEGLQSWRGRREDLELL